MTQARESWQQVGEELYGQGAGIFCRTVLHHYQWSPGQPVVIDGVRHVEVLQALQALVAPLKIYLLYINVDDSVRTERLTRKGISAVNYEHSTETQVQSQLPKIADFIIDGSQPVDELINDIVIQLQRVISV